jgi:hypothetical protein
MKTLHFNVINEKTIKGIEYDQLSFDIENAVPEVKDAVEKALRLSALIKMTPSKNKLYLAVSKKKSDTNLLESRSEYPLHISLLVKYANMVQLDKSENSVETKENIKETISDNSDAVTKEDKDFLFRIINVNKIVKGRSDNKLVGEYDNTKLFSTIYNKVPETISGKFVKLPLNQAKINSDGELQFNVIEDGNQTIISKEDPQYKEYESGKRKLWNCLYTIKLELGKQFNSTTKNTVKKALKLQ